jgi:hypothetical protein
MPLQTAKHADAAMDGPHEILLVLSRYLLVCVGSYLSIGRQEVTIMML